MVQRTEGPFEYYRDIHAGVTGDSIRTDAEDPGLSASTIEALAGELEGDARRVADNLSGDITAQVQRNPTEVSGTAVTLAANGHYAVGLVNSFAAMVDTFDTAVNSLNIRYRSDVASALRWTGRAAAETETTADDDIDEAGIRSRMRAHLQGEYDKALLELDNDADTIAIKFEQGATPANVRELVRQGLVPLSAAVLYGLELTKADREAYYTSILGDMTAQEQIDWINEHKGQLDPAVAGAVAPEAQEHFANEVATAVRDPESLDADTAWLLGFFKDEQAFAHALYSDVSPEEMSGAIQYLNDTAFPMGLAVEGEDEAVQLYKDFLSSAGHTFATYTKGTGEYAPPGNLVDTWFDAITGDDQGGQGARLTLLLRAGGQETSFDGEFLGDLTDRVYDWERNQDGAVWGPRDGGIPPTVNPFLDQEGMGTLGSDGLANLLGAMEHSPDAAQLFFSTDAGGVDEEKLQYLVVDRTFSHMDGSDEGNGLGSALRAAAVGDRDHEYLPGTSTYRDEWSASFTSDVFNLIAENSGTGDGWGPDDTWHMWPGMADDIGTIAAGYSGDVYDIIDGAPRDGATHLDLSAENLDKLLGEIGRGDKTGIETLSAAIMIEGNERINDAIEEWKAEHPGEPVTMDALADSGLGLALQGRGATNGEILGHILNKSVLVDLDDEEIAATRAAYVSKAIDIAGGFIPGAGSVLGEGASHLASSSYDLAKGEGLDLLKGAVEGTASATATEYIDQSRDTTETALEYNVVNQLIRNGYLGGDGQDGIPPSLLVEGANGTRVVNPDLYDADGVDQIGEDGDYTDAEIQQMRNDWSAWMNSQERNIAEGITSQTQDGFDRELNKGPE